MQYVQPQFYRAAADECQKKMEMKLSACTYTAIQQISFLPRFSWDLDPLGSATATFPLTAIVLTLEQECPILVLQV